MRNGLVQTIAVGVILLGLGVPQAAAQCSAAPVIQQQPLSQTLCGGAQAVFTVSASEATTYQWYLNNVALTEGDNYSGTTSARLTISHLTPMASGNRVYCLVSNDCGATASAVATLTVDMPPGATIAADQTVASGANVTMSAFVSGGDVSCRWRRDGVLLNDDARLSGTHSSTLNITGVQASDAGSYDVVVTNLCGTATSTARSLVVQPATPPPASDQGTTGTGSGTSGSTGSTTGTDTGTGSTDGTGAPADTGAGTSGATDTTTDSGTNPEQSPVATRRGICGAPCGAGVLGAMPLVALGIVGIKARARRHR